MGRIDCKGFIDTDGKRCNVCLDTGHVVGLAVSHIWERGVEEAITKRNPAVQRAGLSDISCRGPSLGSCSHGGLQAIIS